MKPLRMKKIRNMICVVVLIAAVYIIIVNFVYAENLGYFVGDVFVGVTPPAGDVYVSAFSQEGIDWEIAYWSGMIAEYTYAKASYPTENFALTTLGFTTGRFYSFFELEGAQQEDLMVDVGVKEVYWEGDSFTLVVFAFRGSVPLALNSPTTRENMRRNMDFFPQPWRGSSVTVHRGFYGQYNDFVQYILPEVNERLGLDILQNEAGAYQDVKIWITGHSMGAALAELFALDLIENGLPPERVMAYGFATPLVANQSLRERAESVGASCRIFRIVHRRDMVGVVGYGVLRGRSLALDENNIIFGNRGMLNRSHHSLPRVYVPFVISQNDDMRRAEMETSLVVEDM